jgi:hypothetical protein
MKNSRAASNGRSFFNTQDASLHRKQMTTPMKCFSLFGILYHFSMTTGTNLGRAGSPSAFAARQSAAPARRWLPAARPHNDCGAHGLSRRSKAKAEVTRPAHVPIPTGNWYYLPMRAGGINRPFNLTATWL